MDQKKSFQDSGEGSSNSLLQDDKANVHGIGSSSSSGTTEPPTVNVPNPPAASPSAPPEELLDLSVGNTAPFDYGKKLFNQLNELKTVYVEYSSQLCNVYSKTSINDISVDDIKNVINCRKKI